MNVHEINKRIEAHNASLVVYQRNVTLVLRWLIPVALALAALNWFVGGPVIWNGSLLIMSAMLSFAIYSGITIIVRNRRMQRFLQANPQPQPGRAERRRQERQPGLPPLSARAERRREARQAGRKSVR